MILFNKSKMTLSCWLDDILKISLGFFIASLLRSNFVLNNRIICISMIKIWLIFSLINRAHFRNHLWINFRNWHLGVPKIELLNYLRLVNSSLTIWNLWHCNDCLLLQAQITKGKLNHCSLIIYLFNTICKQWMFFYSLSRINFIFYFAAIINHIWLLFLESKITFRFSPWPSWMRGINIQYFNRFVSIVD